MITKIAMDALIIAFVLLNALIFAPAAMFVDRRRHYRVRLNGEDHQGKDPSKEIVG